MRLLLNISHLVAEYTILIFKITQVRTFLYFHITTFRQAGQLQVLSAHHQSGGVSHFIQFVFLIVSMTTYLTVS